MKLFWLIYCIGFGMLDMYWATQYSETGWIIFFIALAAIMFICASYWFTRLIYGDEF